MGNEIGITCKQLPLIPWNSLTVCYEAFQNGWAPIFVEKLLVDIFTQDPVEQWQQRQGQQGWQLQRYSWVEKTCTKLSINRPLDHAYTSMNHMNAGQTRLQLLLMSGDILILLMQFACASLWRFLHIHSFLWYNSFNCKVGCLEHIPLE